MKKITKRFLIAGILGIAFGLLCSYLANSNAPDPNFWGSALMYQIVFNRLLIGLVIAMAGAFTFCPICGMNCKAWLRGLFWGAIVSLDIAIGVYLGTGMDAETMRNIFWMTIGAGAVYGLIIDLVATKFAGEGKELLK
jgi:hypothetical protein